MGLIGEFLKVDRVSLMCHTEDGKGIETIYDWVSDRLNDNVDIFTAENTPELHEKLTRSDGYIIRKVDDIPDKWANLKSYYTQIGVKSSIFLPLKMGGRLIGGIAIELFRCEYDWPEVIIQRLRFVSDVFANALTRKKNEERLRDTLKELNRLKEQFETDSIYLQDEIRLEHNFGEIIGQSQWLKQILYDVENVAPTNASVLIQGETGTGKELFARAIHYASQRKQRPMVKINCAALPPGLIENELFGHVKGAYTGADTSLPGRFEYADGSTLFLDEIAELPLEIQPKLLRVIQEGEFERLGSSKTKKVDVRLIAATNRDLEKEVKQGRFRQDLWYRLNVFPVRIPPLRERAEDIPILVNHICQKMNRKHGKSVTRIPRHTLNALKEYNWPGNIRELENVIERAVIVSRTDTLVVDLPKTPGVVDESIKPLAVITRDHIIKTLEKTKWRIGGERGAGKLLGLHPSTLRGKMNKLGIRKPWD